MSPSYPVGRARKLSASSPCDSAGPAVMLSQMLRENPSGCPNIDEATRGASSRRLLDQDVAQVERLAGLDGEVLADLYPLVGSLRSKSR